MKPSPRAAHSRSFPINLYGSALASGAGAVLTGAMLPALASVQHLDDQQAGFLIGVQFLGNFIGAVTVSAKLPRSLLIGQLTAAVGLILGAITLSHTLPRALLYGSFLLFGFGFGQMITAANLIAGAEPAAKRAAHLSFLNLLWGLGAMFAPITIALAAPVASVPAIFAAFSLLLLAMSASLPRPRSISIISDATAEATESAPGWGVFACFALLFFLYGGMENSLSTWLSTYAQRYTHLNGNAMTLVTAVFWAGLNAGRAAGTIVLRHVRERRAIGMAVCGFILSAAGLTRSHSNAPVMAFAAACGLCLAPIFPAALSWTLSWAVERRVPASRIGPILALCGLGASTLPALVGIVSYRMSSLEKALWLPMGYAALMWSILPPQNGTSEASGERKPNRPAAAVGSDKLQQFQGKEQFRIGCTAADVMVPQPSVGSKLASSGTSSAGKR